MKEDDLEDINAIVAMKAIKQEVPAKYSQK